MRTVRTPALRRALTEALEQVKRRTVRARVQWHDIARPEQLAPGGDWRVWFLCTGRKWGKNRTMTEWGHDQAEAYPNYAGFFAGRTLGDVAKYIFNHPESGILATQRAHNPCRIQQQKGGGGYIVRWENGAFADIHTSEEPDRARGGQYAWGIADEVASWKRVVDFDGNTTWDNLQFALTGGPDPRMIAASTPRRGSKLVKELIARALEEEPDVVVTRGTMRDNQANLSEAAIKALERKYGGTSLWRQEGEGEMLPDVEGAIVTTDNIETNRRGPHQVPQMVRVGVAIDPYGGGSEGEVGLVAAGLGVDGHGYVFEDASGQYSPLGWARKALEMAGKWDADFIAAERNFGGDMVESTIRGVDPAARVIIVHASRGKHVRFEPVGGKYEQNHVHHVGLFELLEDEVTGFTPTGYDGDGSPNRADALVWVLTELLLEEASEYHFG